MELENACGAMKSPKPAIWTTLKYNLYTVLASSLDHTFLDWTTLWGCLSELAVLADGWVRRGGPIY